LLSSRRRNYCHCCCVNVIVVVAVDVVVLSLSLSLLSSLLSLPPQYSAGAAGRGDHKDTGHEADDRSVSPPPEEIIISAGDKQMRCLSLGTDQDVTFYGV
jgi:hypothetical protein